MKYCLDTNVLIEAHRRYYAFDIAPAFWDALLRLADQKIIVSSMLVFDELVSSEDALAQWVKENKERFFSLPDEATQKEYSTIADLAVHLYEPQHYQRFLSGADPWVIALAKAHNLVVVTMEARKSESTKNNTGKILGKIKIPNICIRIGVEFTDTFSLLREEKIVFR